MTVLEEDAVTAQANETPDEELTADDDASGEDGPEAESVIEELEALAPAVPPSGAAEEKAFERIEKAAGTYTKAVAKATEEVELGLSQCPCCQLPGLVFPYQGDQSDDVLRRTVVEAYFGQAPPEYPEAPGWVRCELCDGWGYLGRPSRVEDNKKMLCPDCAGMGTREQAAIDAQTSVTNFANGSGAFTPPDLAAVQLDDWGRAAGHPHFGMHPATVGY